MVVKWHIFLLVSCFTASLASAQVTGTVFVARKKIIADPVRRISIFMDGQILCDLRDNSFVQYRTDVGTHKFGVAWTGSGNSILDAIEINVTQSTEFYLRIISKESTDSLPSLLLDQVSGNAWPKLMTGLDELDCD